MVLLKLSQFSGPSGFQVWCVHDEPWTLELTLLVPCHVY